MLIRAINEYIKKAMKKSSTTTSASTFKRTVSRSVIVGAAVFMALQPVMPAFADKYDDQIRAIQQEISGYQSQSQQLASQASTLQNAVSQLDAQKAVIQAQVDLSQTQYNQLTQQIADEQSKLEKQQSLLGSTLTQLYADNDTSSIEILASSKSIGDFLDKQQYRSTVRSQVLQTIKNIQSLKKELAAKQAEVQVVLANQTAQRDLLAQKEQEQADLLAQTQGQEAAYQQLIGTKNSQIASLQAQKSAAQRKYSSYGGTLLPGDSSHGNYPSDLAGAGMDSINPDYWGFPNRECTSYTAWKAHQAYTQGQTTHDMPYWASGANARNWPSKANSAGIPWGGTPRIYAAAIAYSTFPGDQTGHVAWVEGVDGSNVIVSQYNWDYGTGPGQYSRMELPASFFDAYIYF